MARDGRATRDRLLVAGMQLAEHMPLAAMRVDELAAAAAVAKGTFYVHFAAREDFLVALHRRFHDEVASAIESAVEGRAPGLSRLLLGSLAYLDACRLRKGVKAMLLGARTEPAIQREVSAQNQRFAGIVANDLGAAGWSAPQAAARLWVGMVAEAALLEAEAGGAVQDLRENLGHFLGMPSANEGH